jgi:hypothetical protein
LHGTTVTNVNRFRHRVNPVGDTVASTTLTGAVHEVAPAVDRTATARAERLTARV